MSYSNLMVLAKIKAGDAAVAYCIEHKLAAWYVITRVKSGKGPSSKCLVSGPYTTYEDASDMCIHDSYFVEFITTEEAKNLMH